ncbi:M20 family metallopeptidase [Clostridium sp. BJN0013]|uniref:M20 family metallopeptidase n=1 Tax=Clostridium sp. BJN0013 TaxID=3236840 RepID=UPI0034C6369D
MEQLCEVEEIKHLANRYYSEVVKLRRYFHTYPEVSKKEFNTQKKIIEVLNGLDLNIRKAAGTGVIAELKGEKPGKIVAIRADMDALAIDDEINKDYKSKNKGVCHACGHDGHTAMLIGVIKVLYDIRHRIEGTLRFIFQPSEEEVADGSGAAAIIADGGLEGVEAIIGAHLWQPLGIGTVGISKGPVMAASDEFVIVIEGKAGHASMPHQTIDSILTASQIVVALNTIVGRDVDPMKQAVVSVGVFQSGHIYNAISGKAILKGTIRSLDEDVRKEVLLHIKKIVEHICDMAGAHCRLERSSCTYVLNNDSKITDIVLEAGKEIMGEGAHEVKPCMSSEDFSYYLQKVPGCFIFIGIGNPKKGIVYPQHHPKYDIDELALLYGVEVMSNAALKLLSKLKSSDS